MVSNTRYNVLWESTYSAHSESIHVPFVAPDHVMAALFTWESPEKETNIMETLESHEVQQGRVQALAPGLRQL